MPFAPNTFIQPVLDKVLGFSGGPFDPFQQAHQIGDTELQERTDSKRRVRIHAHVC